MERGNGNARYGLTGDRSVSQNGEQVSCVLYDKLMQVKILIFQSASGERKTNVLTHRVSRQTMNTKRSF